VASVPLLAGEGAAATSRHGISFDTVVDMVDDAGCDPNGNEPCDGKLQSAAGSNTLLKFPSGTYKFTGKNAISGNNNFGIVGEGDVTFTVPDGFNDKLLTLNGGNGLLVENITVDQSGATPNVQVAPNDNLQVHDLEIVGQGLASNGNAENAFTPMVRSSGGSGVVEGLVAHNAGRMGAYARVGVWIGSTNKGTITLRNCNVEGFSNNGVYASRTSGVVKVEGGTYKNNDLSQVRIGSSGSYVDGATVEVGVSESNSPNPGDMLNGSGIRLESDRGGSGAEIRNCDIRIGPNVNTGGGIVAFGNYGSFAIKNTQLEFNPDQSYAIRGKSPNRSGDVSATLRNVSVTGNASDWVGVLIEGRPNTTIEDSCIQQTGSDRTGIALHNCDGSRVANTTVNASAQAVRVRNGSVNLSNITESGTCPAPNLGSSSYTGGSSGGSSGSDDSSNDSSSDGSSDDGSSSEAEEPSDDSSSSDDSSDDSGSSSLDDDSSNDSSSDGSSEESSSDGGSSGEDTDAETNPPGDADLLIADTNTAGGRIPYEVATSEDLSKADTAGATKDSNDEVSGSSVSGGVNSWRDSYEYEGEIVELEADGRATIKLDADEKTIVVLENDESDSVDYSIEVSGTLEHADGSREDRISDDDSSVNGSLGGWRDAYNYTGQLLEASVEDSVSITTEPDSFGE
jgi:hypothetical protein